MNSNPNAENVPALSQTELDEITHLAVTTVGQRYPDEVQVEINKLKIARTAKLAPPVVSPS